VGSPVIVEAVRTPIGRRGGGHAAVTAPHLLATAQFGVVERAGIDPGDVDQIVGGCVTQAGMQAFNVARMAWLSRGEDHTAAATTVDCQCGSGLQANNLATGLIATGGARIAIGCGVEHMTGLPLRTAIDVGETRPRGDDWPWDREAPSQFVGAERIAALRGISRADVDEVGLRSQRRAADAWAAGRFDAEVVPTTITRDEGLRDTSLDALGALRPIVEGGVHTAGTASQISDGAAAVLWGDEDVARERGLAPRARITHHTMVGTDPYYYLDGPVEATTKLLRQSGHAIGDFDLIECNEAFASVVLSFQRTFDLDWDRLNVNGGAIALGHPVGATGARLVVSLLHELERRDLERGLITMCQGGSLGIATVIERIR